MLPSNSPDALTPALSVTGPLHRRAHAEYRVLAYHDAAGLAAAAVLCRVCWLKKSKAFSAPLVRSSASPYSLRNSSHALFICGFASCSLPASVVMFTASQFL